MNRLGFLKELPKGRQKWYLKLTQDLFHFIEVYSAYARELMDYCKVNKIILKPP
jgi:hypothetical protein